MTKEKGKTMIRVLHFYDKDGNDISDDIKEVNHKANSFNGEVANFAYKGKIIGRHCWRDITITDPDFSYKIVEELDEEKGKDKRGRKMALNEEQIKELRELAAAAKTKTELARMFGISRMSVYNYLKTSNQSNVV